jgi:hypothetical protein
MKALSANVNAIFKRYSSEKLKTDLVSLTTYQKAGIVLIEIIEQKVIGILNYDRS